MKIVCIANPEGMTKQMLMDFLKPLFNSVEIPNVSVFEHADFSGGTEIYVFLQEMFEWWIESDRVHHPSWEFMYLLSNYNRLGFAFQTSYAFCDEKWPVYKKIKNKKIRPSVSRQRSLIFDLLQATRVNYPRLNFKALKLMCDQTKMLCYDGVFEAFSNVAQSD